MTKSARKRCTELLHRRQEFFVFETEVGIKYRYARFDPHHFDSFVVTTVPFNAIGGDWSQLLIPPDFLKNAHTLCGRPINESPHLRLIEEVASDTLSDTSEYVMRCETGTLDLRSARRYPLVDLRQRCRKQIELFRQRGPATITVMPVVLQQTTAYIIADGKHRAALAAYHDSPESINVNIVTPAFLRHAFYAQLYDRVLTQDSADYHVNQSMIRAIRDETD